ncbi:lytic transglycosylase domain-containing protein [Arsenophonus nasoniae]|uniref:Lytic transglycosylase domain-containing protein n=1 Tax=Arsenophonus nasoniae TaxID=638 RepID=A0AA95GCG6_9GAMM|nr:lytic transglycosylase domain-containing protein [Arsenophonus nasoniae]WGL93953.1 lytic transglycosylase domain-containing protein [Arsenophonus nasoniae]
MILPYFLMCAPLIHPDTLNDIARVESGFNHYAIAVVSKPGKSFLPKSPQEAIEIIQHLEDKNKNYSVGLMQINRVNFKRFRVTGEQLLDGCTNLNVAEKILIDCYHRGKNLKNMLSCYYSGNFKTGNKKESQFANTSYIERIGYSSTLAKQYLVPSTKYDRIKPINKNPENKDFSQKKQIIYPVSVLLKAGVTKNRHDNKRVAIEDEQ